MPANTPMWTKEAPSILRLNGTIVTILVGKQIIAVTGVVPVGVLVERTVYFVRRDLVIEAQFDRLADAKLYGEALAAELAEIV